MSTLPTTLELEAITTATNVRTNLGDVAELAKSIEAIGLLNPITVRELEDGTTELVAGHRRLEALRRLGWDRAPVTYIVTGGDTGKRLAAQLVENLQREDLTPLEEAAGLAELAEVLGTASAAAKAIGRSKAHVSKRLALLTLPPEATELVTAGNITLDQAASMARLEEPEAVELAKRFASGINPGTAQIHLDRALEEQKRGKARDKLIRELNAAGGPKALASMPPGGKSLEGWDGIAVDFDDHLAEPCARWRVTFQPWHPEPHQEQVCSDPDRHRPGGDSTVRTMVPDEEARAAQAQADRERLAAEQAEERARRVGEARRAALALTDRNAALRGLAITVLAIAEPAILLEALEAVGVELPPEPAIGRGFGSEEHREWWDTIERIPHGDTMSAADTYRAAAYVALREVGPCPDHVGGYDRPASFTLAELFGADLDTINGRTRGTSSKEGTE